MVKSEAARKPKVGKRLLIDDGEDEPGVGEAKILRPGAVLNGGGASAGEQAKSNKMLDFLLKERSSLTT